MKKLLVCTILFTIIFHITGCSTNLNDNFYGDYTFNEVMYLSPLSSATKDSINDRMDKTRYTIKAESFKVEGSEYTFEISSPKYIEDDEKYDSPLLFGLDDFLDGVDHKYIVLDENEIEHSRHL